MSLRPLIGAVLLVVCALTPSRSETLSSQTGPLVEAIRAARWRGETNKLGDFARDYRKFRREVEWIVHPDNSDFQRAYKSEILTVLRSFPSAWVMEIMFKPHADIYAFTYSASVLLTQLDQKALLDRAEALKHQGWKYTPYACRILALNQHMKPFLGGRPLSVAIKDRAAAMLVEAAINYRKVRESPHVSEHFGESFVNASQRCLGKSPSVEKFVVRSLSKIRSRGSRALLLEFAFKSRTPSVRSLALQAIRVQSIHY